MGAFINAYDMVNWHVFFELIGIVMIFSIFLITYYTYEQTNRLTSMVISCVFLSTGIFVFLHILSFTVIAPYYTNEIIQKSGVYWKIARLNIAFGLFVANTVKPKKKGNIHQLFFLFISIVFSGLIVFFTERKEFLFKILSNSIVGDSRDRVFEIFAIALFAGAIYFYRDNFKIHRGEKEYIFFIVALICNIVSECSFLIYNEIYDVYYILGQLFRIIAYFYYFKALFVLNVQKPYKTLRHAELEVSEYADNLKAMVRERTSAIEEAQRKLEQDLDYAKNIQLALLPNSFPNIENMEFAARYFPCEKVGGDFYNIFRLDDKKVGILIGDVAGHGVSAAMLNVFINQKIHVKKSYADGRQKIFTPRGVLMNLYHIYNEMSFPDEAYLVMLYCIYDTKTHELSYSSAGMNIAPIILDVNGNVKTIELEGFPICKFGKYFKPDYKTHSVKLDPKDTIIFYTDGLVDMDRNATEDSSDSFLLEFVKGMKEISATEICDDIIDAYFTFVDRHEMLDDVTILVVKTN